MNVYLSLNQGETHKSLKDEFFQATALPVTARLFFKFIPPLGRAGNPDLVRHPLYARRGRHPLTLYQLYRQFDYRLDPHSRHPTLLHRLRPLHVLQETPLCWRFCSGPWFQR